MGPKKASSSTSQEGSRLSRFIRDSLRSRRGSGSRAGSPGSASSQISDEATIEQALQEILALATKYLPDDLFKQPSFMLRRKADAGIATKHCEEALNAFLSRVRHYERADHTGKDSVDHYMPLVRLHGELEESFKQFSSEARGAENSSKEPVYDEFRKKLASYRLSLDACFGNKGWTVLVKVNKTKGLESFLQPFLLVTLEGQVFDSRDITVSNHISDDSSVTEEHTSSIVGPGTIVTTPSQLSRDMSLPGEDENPTAAVSWNLEAVFNATTLEPDINLAVYDQNQQAIGTARIRPSLDKPFHGWLRLMDASNTSKRKMPLVGEIFVQYICRSSTEVMYRPEDFEILHLIGKGSRGRVYQVRKRDTKRLYAMKVFRKEKILNKHDALRERTILATVSGCSFVTNLKFAFQTTTTLHLVMDFHAGGDLSSHQLRQEKGFFDEATAKFYIAEVILALQNLHEHAIIHCSLRPEDILLGADGHIVLVDFGLAIDNIRGLGGGVGLSEVNEFIAPELYLDSGGYTPVVDFWSLGVVAFELSCGWNPFYGEDAQEICKKICMEKVRFPRNRVSAEFKSFIKVLLHRNPKVRLGADHGCKELKDHPAMAGIDWDRLSRKQFDPPFKPQLSSDGDVSYFGTNLTGASSAIAWSDEGAAAITSSQQALFDGFDYAYETALIDDMNSILQL